MRKTEYIIACLISFLLGAGVVYFYNLNWILSKQTATRRLINNFKRTYDLQDKLKANYGRAYDELVACTVEHPQTCNFVEVNTQLEQVKKERDNLKNSLQKLNVETENLVQKL